MSTIFSPITGRGGAVTVLRLSGPKALEITAALAGGLPAPRHASLRPLRWQGRVLDHALVTSFPGPHSFTGEDSTEFSLHGGRAVFAAVSEALVALGGRPAEPGEFSRRAFLNGRMDLVAAEAMADLIAAETEAQRAQAIEGADALQKTCEAWRESLRQTMAQQEALIDFPDEDLPPDVEAGLVQRIAGIHREMQEILEAAPAAARLREGLEFVILGAPNAGKSTLLNALAGEEVAIVSDIPGTTRDAVGVRVDLGGVPVHLTDTAGLRETEDFVEAEGVRRAQARAARADLIIAVAAPGEDFPAVPEGIAVLFVRTKADLAGEGVSAQTGQGMAELRAELAAAAARLTDTKGAATLARPRQIACVRDTAAALERALAERAPECRGEELRAAAYALARLTGVIGVEEILDAVFSGFCIGK
ncbi:tRNA uridine-5-carboxymethylaminomethyl(34) synthesis GTPase MnmE [Acidocella sp.]|uniref:tRNA uridine-5-carboxymethylaminomethyl(34) synthesis GTPase MnmE n=1 Tax=Acidocella sp. TaxID=50710 RepID=UPI00181AE4AA|nr:tRNA uridine-5-carboxymethylaminomethyl(34) synthesis GTPase MnmE [Acidocella sp.]NNM55919.1 tRNA uridine-5-carboxymethylaminomethyl(34) synthesis GTPase MnmE [Acidocella sp.]